MARTPKEGKAAVIGRKANANKARAGQRWTVRRKHEAELVYVANSEPAKWVPGGGRAGMRERVPIFDRSNQRELKPDGIRGGCVSYPGKPYCFDIGELGGCVHPDA